MGGTGWTDDDGLASFCEVMYPRLVGALVLRIGDRDAAEDLAQEALCRVCERWSQVRAMDRPEGWVFTVAFNLSRSWWRRSAVALRARARMAHELPSEAATDDLTTHAWVRDAVAALPARQRDVIVLRYFAGLSVAETATAMRCAEGTVKSLTSKASAGLRLRLTDPEDHVAVTRS